MVLKQAILSPREELAMSGDIFCCPSWHLLGKDQECCAANPSTVHRTAYTTLSSNGQNCAWETLAWSMRKCCSLGSFSLFLLTLHLVAGLDHPTTENFQWFLANLSSCHSRISKIARLPSFIAYCHTTPLTLALPQLCSLRWMPWLFLLHPYPSYHCLSKPCSSFRPKSKGCGTF